MVRVFALLVACLMIFTWNRCLAQDVDIDLLKEKAKSEGLGEKEIDMIKELKSEPRSRSKRSISSWHSLLHCKWDICDVYVRGYYLQGYGCFCGSSYLGTGPSSSSAANPVDGIDACCKVHDNCWDTARPLSWWSSCIGIWHSYEFNSEDCECDTDQADCRYDLCECDSAFADCIDEQWSTFTSVKSCPSK